MFQANSADLEFLFNEAGQKVLINDVESIALLTNANFLNENDERYIHTLDKIKLGDMITYQNEKYLVITEIINKKYGKFKAIIRHCNHYILVAGEIEQVLIGHDPMTGRPIYEDRQGDPHPVPSIIDNKSFSVGGTTQFQVPDNQIIVVLQDNELNRDKLQVNNTFTFEGVYKVIHTDFTKKGLMILTCEMGA
ncbi:hypothetical protein JGK52_03975 [Cytobacillus oceanisediminis]|uniref:hypothetical protein n=1 Tax=Cytobacillus oceanisediminis TaxID=665099 RepID=UPI001D14FD80|nr:hypothetical protein [Cytobacillus oceanisediminis]MCC3645843.1 hypothetical protein [Cytobacillus oceanisediminis]